MLKYASRPKNCNHFSFETTSHLSFVFTSKENIPLVIQSVFSTNPLLFHHFFRNLGGCVSFFEDGLHHQLELAWCWVEMNSLTSSVQPAYPYHKVYSEVFSNTFISPTFFLHFLFKIIQDFQFSMVFSYVLCLILL